MLSFLKNMVNDVCIHFMPPLPKKSYTYEGDDTISKYQIRLKHGTDMYHCHRYPELFEAFYTESSRKNKIACLMVKPCKKPKYYILFSHGGTVDLGNLCNFYYTLANRLNCNIFSYDYSGFGESTGKPTEENVYADAEAAFNIMIEKYGIKEEDIILYGQSLGTAASIHLAKLHQTVLGVVLHSPFLSFARIYLPKLHNGHRTAFYDPFPNIDNIGKISSPILIIHGTNDALVNISHGQKLYKKCLNPVEPLWVRGGGHDNLFTYEEYLTRLKRFVDIDLSKQNK